MTVQYQVGLCNSPFTTLGYTAGAKEHTLTTAQMPAHNHGIAQAGGTFGTPGGAEFYIYNGGTPNRRSTTEGGGQAHPILNPIIVVNYEVIAG